jgi:hypothetical protein
MTDQPVLDRLGRSAMPIEDHHGTNIEIPKKLSRPPQLDALTGLRFFAAFFILISHAAAWTSPFIGSNTLSRFGGIPSLYAMTLFFVLSGFVIHYNYGKLFREMRFRWAATEFIGGSICETLPAFPGLRLNGTSGRWHR